MKAGFRTKTFFAAFAAAAVSLITATILISSSVRSQMNARIERTLIAETRLAAELLSHRIPVSRTEELDEEADRLGHDLGARVTFIAPDGRVVGDSAEDGPALAALENHGSRPEVVRARQSGIGVTRRYSTTIESDLLYVAMPVAHTSIAFVRLALPLTDIDQQLRSVRTRAGVAFAIALSIALVLAWAFSAPLARRVETIAAAATRYSTGDLSRPLLEFGDDELGMVARVLDRSVQELGGRAAELARDRARMEALLSGMVEGVLVVDDTGRLQLVNRAVRRMLKLRESDAGGHYVTAVRHPGIVRQLGAALEGREPERLEVSLGSAGGTFLARAAPVRSAAGNGAVLVLHDISDLRRADQIRRDFVANVSHELRTPLTAIRGYVEALLEDHGDADRRRFLEIIGRHTSRMERLVTDLLRLARLDAGQERLDVEPCDVSSLFSSVRAELARSIDDRHQQVDQAVEDDASMVLADPAKLHDAMKNLLQNAVAYAPERSRIRLTARSDTGRISLSVADNGAGIPEADLPRVFERFYRVDKSRARDPGGTGLGLAIVKHLVELHGGEVHAANQAAGGAIFTILLPRHRDERG